MQRDTTVGGDRREARERTWGEWLALAIGAVYALVGLLGFTVTDGVGFAAQDGDQLFGIFEVNPLHNIVHLLIGIALIGAFLASREATMWTAYTIGAVFGLLAIAGPFITGDEANILALNDADHWLHAVSALGLIAAGYGSSRATERQADGREVRGRDVTA